MQLKTVIDDTLAEDIVTEDIMSNDVVTEITTVPDNVVEKTHTGKDLEIDTEISGNDTTSKNSKYLFHERKPSCVICVLWIESITFHAKVFNLIFSFRQ